MILIPPWVQILIAAALLAATPALAQTQTSAKDAPVLRGAQQPTPAPAPLPQRQTPWNDPTALDGDSLTPDFSTSPRVGGYSAVDPAAQCRQACNNDYYQCRATDEIATCSAGWGQCLSACISSNPSGR